MSVAARAVDTRRVVVDEASQGPDPMVGWLKFGIFFVFLLALTVVLYGLLVGFLRPTTPRTATEANLTVLKAAVQKSPESGENWLNYVQALSASGQTPEAWDQLDRARKSLKGLELTYADLAEVHLLFTDKEYAKAEKLAVSATARDATERKKWIQSQATRGITVNSADIPFEAAIGLRVYQARSAGAQKDWKGAVEALNAGLVFDSRASDLLVLRGDAYAELGETEKARADYESAMDYIPDFQPAKAGLARLEGAK